MSKETQHTTAFFDGVVGNNPRIENGKDVGHGERVSPVSSIPTIRNRFKCHMSTMQTTRKDKPEASLALSHIDTSAEGSPITAAAIAARRRRGEKTQNERSSDMRGRLLEATLTSLTTLGFAGTSFSTIANLAGVSRGALQHHYPEKNYVIAAALEVLSKRVLEDFLPQAAVMPQGSARIAFVLDHIWLATQTGAMTAVTDIRMAARTDTVLRSMLLPLEHRVRERQYQLISDACGGHIGQSTDFARRVDAVLATVRGLGIQLAYGWEPSEVEAAWAVAREDFVAGFQRAEELHRSSK